MPTLTRRRALLAGFATLAVMGTTAPAVAATTETSIAVPSSPVALPTAIEVMPPYQPQTFCNPVAKPGTLALATLLTTTYAGTSIVSLTRPCGSDTSEHYDGRAIDWGVDHRDSKQRAVGKAFLHWLFAADATGDTDAMVRRLGVMYVIWNKRIWGAWDQRWEPYSCSGVTACHVDHMHISLDWSGAMKKTSFWTGVVRRPMHPPLVKLKAIGVTTTTTVSAHDPSPTPVYKLVAGAHYRLTVTGTYRYDRTHGDRADAVCNTGNGSWSPAPPDTMVVGTLRLLVNGNGHWHPDTANAPSGCDPQHRYHRTVTTTTSATPLTLTIDDGWADRGSLTVTVRRTS